MQKQQIQPSYSAKVCIAAVETLEVPVYELSAAQFASINQVKPQTVYARVFRTGSYFGVVPLKLANERLSFPNIQVKANYGNTCH